VYIKLCILTFNWPKEKKEKEKWVFYRRILTLISDDWLNLTAKSCVPFCNKFCPL